MKTIQSLEALWEQWSAGVPNELLQKDGIKAQFAAAAAVIMHLNTVHADGEWSFTPVAVGSYEDRVLNIDGYLCQGKKRQYFAVDFSLEGECNPRGNKANCQWLVHLQRDWFDVRSDGMWVLRKGCMNLLARAFLRTLEAGPVAWKPGICEPRRKAS